MLDTAGNVLNQIMADNWLHLHLPEEGGKHFRLSFKSPQDISNPERVCLIVAPDQIISVFVIKHANIKAVFFRGVSADRALCAPAASKLLGLKGQRFK